MTRPATRSPWRGEWPIPKTIDLPGLKITVVTASSAVIGKLTGGYYGGWTYRSPVAYKPEATIYLNSELPIAVQRYTLWHELIHAVNDGLDQLVEKFPEHVQTMSMAAPFSTAHRRV